MQHFPKLNNRYFVLRHGHSEANAQGLIVSNPSVGVDRYGLTTTGRQQVGASLQQQNVVQGPVVIYSSDFLRARQTAEIAETLLESNYGVQFDKRLRERYFGRYDMDDNQNYAQVWAVDKQDIDSEANDVESVSAVLSRVLALVSDLESTYMGEQIVLVAHGDILQILQTAFLGWSPDRHRDVDHLETAELRELT